MPDRTGHQTGKKWCIRGDQRRTDGEVRNPMWANEGKPIFPQAAGKGLRGRQGMRFFAGGSEWREAIPNALLQLQECWSQTDPIGDGVPAASQGIVGELLPGLRVQSKIG